MQNSPAQNASLSTLQQVAARLSTFGDVDAVLSIEQEGGDLTDYRELAKKTDALAAGLANHGVKAETPVALFASPSVAWITACLAVLRCGATVVPVDAQFRNETLQHVLDNSGAAVVFSDAETSGALQDADLSDDVTVIRLDDGECASGEIAWKEMLTEDTDDTQFAEVEPDHRAALFYTSGTTGMPKGVPLTHGNLVSQIKAVANTPLLDRTQRLLQPLPLHHVYPFVLGTVAPLALGCVIVFPAALTGPQLIRAIGVGEVTVIVGVPRLYSAMVEGIENQLKSTSRIAYGIVNLLASFNHAVLRLTGRNLGRKLLFFVHRKVGRTLDFLACGGSPLNPELATRLEDLGWDVVIGYGLTETSPLLTLRMPEDRRPESVGRPVQDVTLQIDTDAAPDSSPDGLGEVLAKGPNVFAGYHELPDETKQSFNTEGWFRTGDLGRINPDGFLYLQGRRSTMIVTPGGENLQPESVEDAYSKHPAIAEIGVFQRGDKLAAVVVPEMDTVNRDYNGDRARAVSEALREQGGNLPSYMRLAEHAVSSQALARTRLGKIRRHLLEDHFKSAIEQAEGETTEKGPMPVEQMSDRDQALLDNDAARKVWRILADRYPDRRLTPDTDVGGELGLDSLAWVSLTLDLRREAGVELDEAAVGRIQTVRDLLQESVEAGTGAGQDERGSPLEDPEQFIDEKQAKWLKPLNPVQRCFAAVLYCIVWLLMKTYFRVTCNGIENLPEDDGAVVLAPNHTSFLDPFALTVGLGFKGMLRTNWAGWTGVAFKNVLFRWVSRLAQAVPIDAQRASLSSLAFAAAILKRGGRLVWFPEGARSWDGELQEFQGGLGVVLKEIDAQVCPVHIEGAHEALPRGAFFPRPRRITITIGAPLTPSQLAEQGEGNTREDRITTGLHRELAHLQNGKA